MAKYVIIGNSAAAIGAVEAIRKNDATGDIRLVSDETHHTYSRPLISYLLLGKTDRERMKYRPDDFYEKNGVRTKLGVAAQKINPAAHTVELSDGETVVYEKLLVATGSSPFVPPMDGLDSVKNKFTFQTLDSALALEKAIKPESRVLIIGAGLIGLKCAEGIRDRVASITFVDLAPRVLPSILDDDAATLVRERLEAAGLRFYLGDSVAKFSGNIAALKESGEAISFDILVLAVGVRPNTALVKDAGGACGRAITVNEFSATSLPDVYAAGDCTESVDPSTGDTKVMAILPNAYLQGETAGFNMSGIKYSYDKLIPYNAIGFFGIHIVSAGSYTGETYFTREGNNFKRLYYSGNKLSGFILIGDKPGYGDSALTPAYEKAGIYTSLIREGTPLDTIDFDLICRLPGMMAFSKDVRVQKLGGEV